MDPTYFKFGDKVECRSGGDWLTGFYFIAYVPDLGAQPFIVKGDLKGHTLSFPFRAHIECRRAQ